MATALPLCYHGAISLKEAEELLDEKNKDGAYLIRDSQTLQGAMCLCVYKKKMVYTYRLFQTRNGQWTLLSAEGVAFKTLDDLICHYKKKHQGLAMHLCCSVKRKTAFLVRPHRAPATPCERGSNKDPEETSENDYDDVNSTYVEVLP